MTLSREAEPSGELAKDEFKPWGWGELCQVTSVVTDGIWHRSPWAELTRVSADDLRALAKHDPDPLGWPRALAFFEEHCGKENENGSHSHGQVEAEPKASAAPGLLGSREVA